MRLVGLLVLVAYVALLMLVAAGWLTWLLSGGPL